MQNEARERHRTNAYFAYAEVDANRCNEVMRNLYPRLARGDKTSEDEAEGDAHADGVATYSEVCARPDNEVLRSFSPRGRR